MERLFNENNLLPQEPETEDLSEVLDACRKCFITLGRQLNQRFDQKGMGTHAYAVANLLNPYYKGIPLKKAYFLEDLITKLVNEHPSTRAFNAARPANPMDVQQIPDLDDACTQMLIEAQDEAPAEDQDEAVPPLKREITFYLSMQRSTDKNVDILKWWAQQQKQLPLLVQLVR